MYWLVTKHSIKIIMTMVIQSVMAYGNAQCNAANEGRVKGWKGEGGHYCTGRIFF
jgi:hypothetical protein